MKRLLIVVLVLVLAALACNGGDGSEDSIKEFEIEAEVVEKIESAQTDIQEVVEQLGDRITRTNRMDCLC